MSPLRRPPLPTALLVLSLAAIPLAAHAGVMFTGCVTGSDGSITCNTVPTGNTRLNEVDARYGLLQNASPGWSEFSPYQGYNQELGAALIEPRPDLVAGRFRFGLRLP